MRYILGNYPESPPSGWFSFAPFLSHKKSRVIPDFFLQLPSPRLSINEKSKADEQRSDQKNDPFDPVIRAFQDVRYMGVLRERWKEIKKLHEYNNLATK